MEYSKKDKKAIQTEQQILHLLINIIELYPHYTFSQHLIHLLRTKGDKVENYMWDNEKLLKKIESYYDELNLELI